MLAGWSPKLTGLDAEGEGEQSPSSLRDRKRTIFSYVCKRALDLGLALSLLLLLAPLFAIIALAIALESPGDIFFRQRRTGLKGRVFTIFKFRSMRVVEDGDVIAHAVEGDARITRVGAFLRETSLDELPQLINVVRGDMSIVGPRPHALAHDKLYGALIPDYAERFAVRPGLTGFAQMQGLRGEIRTLSCMTRRVQADIDYARNWAFLTDVSIIIRTVPTLLLRTNAR